jgi:hypothetical protein
MASKRAPRKATKKPAPKSPSHRAGLHLLRAYEHLGRIEIIEGALTGKPFCDVSTLSALAQQEFTAGRTRHSADLLRAAEHLNFAALAPRRAAADVVSPELKASISAEFDHLLRRAADHWSESQPTPRPKGRQTRGNQTVTARQSVAQIHIAQIYAGSLQQAHRAFAAESYCQALELARAADALTRINLDTANVPDPHEQRHRLAS